MEWIIVAIIALVGLSIWYFKYRTKEQPLPPKEEEPPIDKPEPEPSPYTEVKDLQASETEQVEEKEYTNTKVLREQFKKDDTIYKLPEGEFYTYGILPEDPVEYLDYKGDRLELRRGDHGIILLEDVSGVSVIGSGEKGATLFTIKPAMWFGDWGGKGVPGSNYPYSGYTMSRRKFIRLDRANNSFIYNMNVRSNNIPEDGGRPRYLYHFEFEHGIHADNSQFVHVEKFTGEGLWGDGGYIRNCADVYMREVTIRSNGRQGWALVSGKRCYIEKLTIGNSPRSGLDIEGNVLEDDSEDFVIAYSYFDNRLVGLPMGGVGLVKNVLCINNEYTGDPIFARGNATYRKRENIMVVRNKARVLGDYLHTNNILIDGIEQDGLGYNSLRMASFTNCTNITIRNCDMTKYGRLSQSQEPFFYVRAQGTPISEFKIYDNKQKIAVLNADDERLGLEDLKRDTYYFLVKSENIDIVELFEEWHSFGIVKNPKEGFVLGEDQSIELLPFHFPEYVPTEEEKTSIPFETSEYMEMQWYRLYTNGHGWREENYVDDGWRPEWVKENYKKIGL